MIMRTIKGTRREEIEMIGNLNMFRSACFHLQDTTMNDQIKIYIENITYSRNYHTSSTKTIKTMHPTDALDKICELFSNKNIRFFQSCKVGNVRYTTMNYSSSKVADDSAVLFQQNHEIHFGLINSIFIDEQDDILLEIWPLSNSTTVKIFVNGQHIDLPSVQEGTLENNNNFYYVSINDIVEKCVYWKTKPNQVIFFRYPNLEEGS